MPTSTSARPRPEEEPHDGGREACTGRGLRIDTAAWGAALLANAVVHVVLVYTLPIDLIALVTTVVWFAALAGLITWHVWYLRKEGLEA